jgi:hypothetical protein
MAAVELRHPILEVLGRDKKTFYQGPGSSPRLLARRAGEPGDSDGRVVRPHRAVVIAEGVETL